MKILITGATGFVGRSLVKRLLACNLNPNHLVCSVRNRSIPELENVEQKIIDAIDEHQNWDPFLKDIQVVLHCAARVHVMNEVAAEPLTEFRRINVGGTLRLARQAAESGVRRFVFISSIKVNGEATQLGESFKADDVPAPSDPYSISKMEAEKGLMDLSNQTKMEVVIIRPPLIYGSGVKANFASMMQWLKRGIPLPLGAITTNRRSLVYIENLVDLIITCIDHPKAANQIFLVSDGDDVSTTILCRKIAKALGCQARLFKFTPLLIKLAAKCIGKPELADRLCDSLQIDIVKTKELLNWNPKFSLDEGLIKTVAPMIDSAINKD